MNKASASEQWVISTSSAGLAGYTKSKTGLTVSAEYHHTLTAFPGSSAEKVLLNNGDSWAASFSARCERVATTRFDTNDNSVWSSAVNLQTPPLDFFNLLSVLGTGIVDITLSASVNVRYTITPCTTADGNFALLVGLAYKSGDSEALSIGKSI